MPVPHKDDKRPNVPVSEHGPPPPHHEIRYHQIPHNQMAMIHEHQIRQQAEIQRRQQNAVNVQYQMERERREEQFRQVRFQLQLILT